MSIKRISRRTFLKGATAAAGVLSAPLCIPSSALGRDGATAPSNRICYGYVGCGKHGSGWNFDQVFRYPDAQIIAVCDVDSNHLRAARQKVDAHYGRGKKSPGKGCAVHGDFRDLINRPDVDVVGIATPDHGHAIPAVMAAKVGKDVICEKPLSWTVAEGRIVSDVMRQTGRIFQTASENRSIDVYLRLIELVRSGVLGKLRHIEVRLLEGNTRSRVSGEAQKMYNQVEPADPPKSLDYEMWLGQAPEVPYIPARLHGNFRWSLIFSDGVICDWGAHLIDLAQWGHDSERTGPVTVEGKGDFPPREAVHNTAPTFNVRYEYADGVTMTVSAGGGDLDPNRRHDGPVVGRTAWPGIRFEGTDGWIESHGWRGALRASNRPWLDLPIDPEQVKIYRPGEIVPRKEIGRGGEHRNFLDCVKSRKPCYAPAETGHRTITIPHIGNIAMLLGRKLRWNPEAERFVDDPQADAMLSRPQRRPWTFAHVDSWIKNRRTTIS
ncbi:MAG: Gfo/Idh/MocA family oxidoreductase [Pirellulales bacterium]|nr:Gfo/Idh/MocA family oxidoreductase [Pirellulales bacterium]